MMQFGDPASGAYHMPRPAGFGIAERGGRIAVVRVRPESGGDWLDLPGGALDPGEDAVQAIVREFGEETGLVVTVGAPIVADVAQLFVKSDGQAVNNRGPIHAVAIQGEDDSLKIEDDHTLIWIAPDEAVRRLRHDSHAWAVAKWLRGHA